MDGRTMLNDSWMKKDRTNDLSLSSRSKRRRGTYMSAKRMQ